MGRKLLIRVLDLKRLAIEKGNYGPWVVKVGRDMDCEMDCDYLPTGCIKVVSTVRQEVLRVEGVVGVVYDRALPPKAIRLEGVAA